MQQQQSRLDGKTKIAFGVTANSRYRIVSWGVFCAGIVAATIALSHDHSSWLVFWLFFWVLLLPTAIIFFCGRNEFVIDFSDNTYVRQVGSYPAIKTHDGLLSEIVAVHIGRQILVRSADRRYRGDIFDWSTTLVFREELHRPPFRMDYLPCSVPIYSFRERIGFCVDLARRLNIPLYDDSGWREGDSPLSNPPTIVIQPGEQHPIFAPKVWKKW